MDEFFQTLYQIHCIDRGHTGQDKSADQIFTRFFGLPRQVVRLFVKLCLVCCLKIGQHSQPALNPIRSHNVWERIQIDLIDMRNNPDDGHNYLAHVIDHFSNYNILYPVKHKSAEEVRNIHNDLV